MKILKVNKDMIDNSCNISMPAHQLLANSLSENEPQLIDEDTILL